MQSQQIISESLHGKTAGSSFCRQQMFKGASKLAPILALKAQCEVALACNGKASIHNGE